MILEGIVTTLNADGSVHIAPMGPDIGEDPHTLVLKPFQTSTTFQNLQRHPEGVMHVTDDALLLARAAVGQVEPLPPSAATREVRGFYLTGCCRYLEFRITSADTTVERSRLRARVLHEGRLRDFFGFNRGKHAVVEAAILTTRLHFLPLDEVAREFERLQVLVEKTGGSAEHQAFRFLQGHLANIVKAQAPAGVPDAGPRMSTTWPGS